MDEELGSECTLTDVAGVVGAIYIYDHKHQNDYIYKYYYDV